ncbi:hypothetical protein JVT61DRAFT_4203 [Boletus reticuloceps]|uniref:Secreted protein n=1 Tax=Boletus reticuloceps TaxID=495285 RepID=A0A8I2YMZ3_9AGAM|nr:hypothetical protein JVT61DRAFT_4203 [Boletus reticuloceps]
MDLTLCRILCVPAFALTLLVNAQSGTPPSSWPQVCPGMPNGDYSPEWQTCACKRTHHQTPSSRTHPFYLCAQISE